MRQTQKNRRRDLSEFVGTPPNGSTKEERLDDITLYWLTSTLI